MDRLVDIISRAYSLALQVQEGKADPVLAEEISGECAELLAHLNNDEGAFGDEECKDQELVDIARLLLELRYN
jgi:hypothetical protein